MNLMFFKSIPKLPPTQLQDTLKKELLIIESYKEEMHVDEYEQSRKLAIAAHRTSKAAEDALDLAKNSLFNLYQWQFAYTQAKKADQACNDWTSYKMIRTWTPKVNFQLFLFQMLTAAFIIPKVTGFIARRYHLTLDQAEDLAVLMCIITFLPSFYSLMLKGIGQERLSNMIQPSWTNALLTEARLFNIDIQTIQCILPDNKPWTNAQILKDIHCKVYPEDFDCYISKDVMNEPVCTIFDSNPVEKEQIDQWLCQKNKHPLTDDDLYWDDLIPAHELKAKIDQFVFQKTKEYIQHELMNNLLEQIEMKAEDDGKILKNIKLGYRM